MKKAFILIMLVIGLTKPTMADGEAAVNATVDRIAQCNGLIGDELKRCLGQKGVLGVISGFFGVNIPDPHSFVSNVRSKATDIHQGAKNFFGNLTKGATRFVYQALGKQDLAEMADEGSKFLGPLAWRGWSKQTFPTCIKSGEPLSDEISDALKKWRNTLIDNGIPPSSDTNVAALKAMGFEVPVNAKNMTVISHLAENGATMLYWRKSPWGWMPCSQDGKNILNSDGQVVPISNINENIATGKLITLIWIKDAGTMETLSDDNAHRLVDNNLAPFMPQVQMP